jgi:two-component system CheB/CheR fusion protein
MRIFIAENHEDTLRWLGLYLEDCGHTVITARTLAESLAALPGAHCDVLISDIGLPDGDGWELLEKVRLPHPIFAIAMSGFGRNADSERSRAVGYRYHLIKPFKMTELDKILEEAAGLATQTHGKNLTEKNR